MAQAIVMGGGFGGIAAALRTRKLGYEVTLVERLDGLGGRARVFKRGGFIFDAGPTVITAPFLFEELFALFGKDWRDYFNLVPVEPWYSLRFKDGSEFRYGGSFEDFLEQIRKFEPGDVLGYRRLYKECQKIFGVGFKQLGDHPFLSAGSMVAIAPNMVALQSYLTVYDFVSKYIKNANLRRALSFHPLLVGGNPFTTTSIYSLIHFLEREYGVWFAMGGTGAVVEGLTKLLKEVGIEIKLNCSVAEILCSNDKVSGIRLEDGTRMDADLVVCNADPPFVYKKLLPGLRKKKWTKKKVDNLLYSMGLFVVYFGTKRTYSDVSHHTILFGDKYKEALKNIFDVKVLEDDLNIYLHAPTRTDPTMAPPGCECFYALVPVPNLQAKINWAEVGPVLQEKVLAHLESTILPDLRENIVEKFFVTPEYFESELLSQHGTGFSIQPTLMQSAYFRFHSRSEEVDNLYFVGAGTHPGAGLPGVLTSAKVVEKLLPAIGA